MDLHKLLKKFIDGSHMNDTKEDPCFSKNATNFTASCGNELTDMFDIASHMENKTNVGHSEGLVFFTYFTPVIFMVGIIGNLLSLKVFVTKNMRKLSASVYLAALSTADLFSLVFFVLIEWIKIGIRSIYGSDFASFLDANGACQFTLLMTYLSRFMSSWLVVCFTLERYIGICHPFKRREICNVSASKKIVLGLTLISLVISFFRPWLNEVRHIGPKQVPWCIRKNDHVMLSFVYDCVFAVCITFLPFIIITTLNILIIRTLIRRKRRHMKSNIITEESIIRFEFTVILITISFCFITFNSPYAVVWFHHFLQTSSEKFSIEHGLESSQNLYYFTKSIFFMNYCVNFFLYSVTGAYFRKELKALFKNRYKRSESYHRCSVHNNHSMSTHNSWM